MNSKRPGYVQNARNRLLALEAILFCRKAMNAPSARPSLRSDFVQETTYFLQKPTKYLARRGFITTFAAN